MTSNVAQVKTWCRVFAAILAVASGRGEVSERVAFAFESCLSRVRPEEFDDLPGPLRTEFASLLEEIKAIAGTERGETREMRASRAVERLVVLYDRLIRQV